MNLEDYLFNSLTQEYHQSYIKARQEQGMDFIANFDDWIAKTAELDKLKAQDQQYTWENSEHNPANYPEYKEQDTDTKEIWELKGRIAYNDDQKALDNQINALQALLAHPDELEKVTIDDTTQEHWEIND